MSAQDQSAEREALKSVRASKSPRATRGHREAGVAFVSYEGAAADLNELASYVSALERAVDAALFAREVPAREGWQLVPKEPTLEMKLAGERELCLPLRDLASIWVDRTAAMFTAMLAAAPQAPTTEGSER